MDTASTRQEVDRLWDDSVIPTLSTYITIPNQSPLFDPQWQENGHMKRAVDLVREWIEKQQIPNSRIAVLEGEGRTPLILFEVEGTRDGSILLYGHLDKQPPFEGWEPDLDPWKPVLRDGRLYGRGSADDGYAAFAAVSAIKTLKTQKIPHCRLVMMIEACEESGSYDLPYYVEKAAPAIGTPDLIICLDSGCGNYEQLWLTTSLRGSFVGELRVEVLREGVHSGDASGVIPSSFRILRSLLDRLEESNTGKVKPEWLYVDIPQNRIEEARKTSGILGEHAIEHYPLLKGVEPMTRDLLDVQLNRTWKPTVSYIGQGGMPEISQSGNVLRPWTSLMLSIRTPPTLEVQAAVKKTKELLEADPPYGAKVTFKVEKGGSGWNSPELAPWLEESISKASQTYFGKPLAYLGEGGSIPFMGMLGQKFPKAQFMITGVLGPGSNAHGPNEFLHVQTAKNLSACVAQVIADFSGGNR
jgi:acetylornithine deacetylase/succinyl-diaminopimelate desuccinylase-like protein